MNFGPITLTWIVGVIVSSICIVPLFLLFGKASPRNRSYVKRD